jgi:hypothetical protein
MTYFPALTEIIFSKPYTPAIAQERESATFNRYKDSSMGLPVTGYVVLVYHTDVGSHHPQFQSIDEAEEFANDLRALTHLTVSEPIPVIATESHKVKVPN